MQCTMQCTTARILGPDLPPAGAGCVTPCITPRMHHTMRFAAYAPCHAQDWLRLPPLLRLLLRRRKRLLVPPRYWGTGLRPAPGSRRRMLTPSRCPLVHSACPMEQCWRGEGIRQRAVGRHRRLCHRHRHRRHHYHRRYRRRPRRCGPHRPPRRRHLRRQPHRSRCASSVSLRAAPSPRAASTGGAPLPLPSRRHPPARHPPALPWPPLARPSDSRRGSPRRNRWWARRRTLRQWR